MRLMLDKRTMTGIAAAVALAAVGGFFVLVDDAARSSAPEAQDPDKSAEASSATPTAETPNQGETAVTAAALAPLEDVTVVTFTEKGYEPSSVEIVKGGTVRFENRSNRDTWPASAFHPTHTIYPEKTAGDCLGSAFDACRGVPPGESWAFTFNSVGSWRYHDHLNASKTGTVVVK